ncbi:MAG: serine/threonine-protein kinase, partial [Planctomycetota bacterium]
LVIAEPNGLGPQKAAFFAREIGKGLTYLHERGLVHRDLKPGNIFYEDGYVKIGDYGLSKFIAVSRHSAQTASVGTVHYMAPEVGSGNYSRGVDIYALGVMLYEMLLGRVPFEGSSLGEVLMKHLTEQPEVDELPHPFGQVIRKSLAKDPKDRYQTVEEMVEELFGVDDVKESLAGFNPRSLSGAVRRAVGDFADSPIPSPNPPRPVRPGVAPYGPPAAGGPPPHGGGFAAGVLGDRLAKRIDRVSRKLDKRLDKLGGKGRRQAAAAVPPAQPVGPRPAAQPIPKSERVQRVVLSGIMALGIATGIGLLIGVFKCQGEGILGGVSSFMLVVAISGGVLLSHWLTTAKLSSSNPKWASRVVLTGCCLPGMFVAALPVMAGMRSPEQGVAVLGALLVATLFARWDSRLRSGAGGELQAGPAFGLALAAGILAMVFQAAEFSLMAAGVAAAASLSVQALGWAFPSLAGRSGKWAAHSPGPKAARREAAAAAAEVPVAVPTPAPPSPGTAEPGWALPAGGSGPGPVAMAIPVQQGVPGAPRASNFPLRPVRSTASRAWWSLVAFILAAGTIMLLLVSVLVDFERWEHSWDHTGLHWSQEVADYDAYMGLIVGCVACFSFFIFSLRKTTQRKRLGFWRETLRPFLQAVSMVGMGAAITALAMGDHMLGIDDFAWAGAIVGLVISSLLFLVLLFVRGRRPHRAFFVAGEPLPAAPVAQPAPEAQPGDANGTAAEVETQEQVGRPDETMTAQSDESPDQPEAKAG